MERAVISEKQFRGERHDYVSGDVTIKCAASERRLSYSIYISVGEAGQQKRFTLDSWKQLLRTTVEEPGCTSHTRPDSSLPSIVVFACSNSEHARTHKRCVDHGILKQLALMWGYSKHSLTLTSSVVGWVGTQTATSFAVTIHVDDIHLALSLPGPRITARIIVVAVVVSNCVDSLNANHC